MSESRTRIKICSITNVEDARAAVELGADALGFIFVTESLRCIDATIAYEIGTTLPPFVAKVAVIRDINRDVIGTLPKGIDCFQYYTNERQNRRAPGMAGYSRFRRIRAYPLRDSASLELIAATHEEANAILLDAYHPDKLGGSGETFDWELAREAKERFGKPIILAGGLTPENVGDAIAAVRPYAVDVSSGVEAEPGRKDHAKLKAFIDAVRKTDNQL